MIRIYAIPDPMGEFGQEICSGCGCFWRGTEAHDKDEWCSEPTPFIGERSCYCHSEDYWTGYLNELDRIDAEAKETVIGYLDPSGKGEGNWLGFTSFRDDVA